MRGFKPIAGCTLENILGNSRFMSSMRHQLLPRYPVIYAVKSEFQSGSFPNTSQNILKRSSDNVEFVSKLLDRKWSLSSPDTKINQIKILESDNGGLNGGVFFGNDSYPCLGEEMMNKSQEFLSFYVVRDDLLHPLVNGNKARKLDALLPLLEDCSATDVVTCGGCQSAHAAAVAVSCAERGLKSHLLLRGEEPEILTGYNLVSRLYGNVVYIPRSVYADREEMLMRHAESVVDCEGSIMKLEDILEASFKENASGELNLSRTDSVVWEEKLKKVVIVNEGAGDAIALLGVIRLIQYLSQDHLFGKKQFVKIVVDAGTGTTAIGLALGVLLLGLPWKITAVMLADKIEGYRKKEQSLISEFLNSSLCSISGLDITAGIVHWVYRSSPRKFGNILEGEVQECEQIAKQTGILVDPIYTLAGWDLASRFSQEVEQDAKIVMIHTGGTLGMFGLAQRYKPYFQMAKAV